MERRYSYDADDELNASSQNKNDRAQNKIKDALSRRKSSSKLSLNFEIRNPKTSIRYSSKVKAEENDDSSMTSK